MELGSVEETIIKQASNMGRATPKAIANKPKISPGNALFYSAFQTLDGERQIGMSLGPIPWSMVRYYATTYEFSDSQETALYYVISQMDAAKLNYVHETNKPKAKVQHGER